MQQAYSLVSSEGLQLLLYELSDGVLNEGWQIGAVLISIAVTVAVTRVGPAWKPTLAALQSNHVSSKQSVASTGYQLAFTFAMHLLSMCNMAHAWFSLERLLQI